VADKTFQFRLVTPQGKLIDSAARYASVPAHDGLIGFEHMRAPIVFKLGMGTLRVDFADDDKSRAAGGSRSYYVEDGFGQMIDNRLTILATRANAAETLTVSDVQAELNTALNKKASTPAEAEQVRKEAERARKKLELAKSSKGI
jgi:F0F1-type ATP synthase epsilon subunit